MDNSLQAKLAKVEDDHFADAETEHLASHDQQRRDQAMQMFGAAKYADRLRAQVASQVILFLMSVEENKYYLEFGCKTFVEFLSNGDLSDYSKTQYYKRRELVMSEGVEKYDLYEEWKLPLTLREKLLKTGLQIEVEGNEIVIGGTDRVAVSQPTVVKAVIEKLVKEKLDVEVEKHKSDIKADKLQTQLKNGQQEYEILQRKYDDATQMRPFDRSLMMSVHWQLSLLENVSTLPDIELKKRGYDDLKLLAGLFFRLRDAYKIDMALADFNLRVNDTDLDKKINDILADGDLSEGEE
jgi:hypothetical protein